MGGGQPCISVGNQAPHSFRPIHSFYLSISNSDVTESLNRDLSKTCNGVFYEA